MDHFKPHRGVTFEGYYTRFHLSGGGSLLVIICSIARPVARPHNLIVTYVPPSDGPIWQSETWPATHSCTSDRDGLVITASGAWDNDVADGKSGLGAGGCEVRVHIHSTGGTFDVRLGDGFVLHADLDAHVPWSSTSDSPEGRFADLPFLPLHWHVLSTRTPARVQLTLPPHLAPYPAPASDARSSITSAASPRTVHVAATAHLEKNWAVSFPQAHVWVQGYRVAPSSTSTGSPGSPVRPPTHHTLTLAGGPILGVEAYLVGYRNSSVSPAIEADFRPPWTLDVTPLLGKLLVPLLVPRGVVAALQRWLRPVLAPFVDVEREWVGRRMRFDFVGARYRVEVEVAGGEGGFYNFSGPYPGGFKEKWMAQSLRGACWVRCFKRRWAWRLGVPWRWEMVCEDWFEDVGMEFGGEYYPNRGVGEETARARARTPHLGSS